MNMAAEWGIFSALWRRDMLRLQKERSRWLGVVLQPLVFWFVIGSGMSGVFHLESPDGGSGSYLEFFFPGILVMIVLFTAIFGTISIIEDRHSGFLQAVLVAPGSRTAMVLGKTAGVVTLALLQSALFLALMPLAGYGFGDANWGLLLVSLILGATGLTGVGVSMAWILPSAQAYHGLMSVLLLPLWILSGAMFPAPEGSWVAWVMAANPMTYAVSAAREAMAGHPFAHDPSMTTSLIALLVFSIVGVGVAVRAANRSG